MIRLTSLQLLCMFPLPLKSCFSLAMAGIKCLCSFTVHCSQSVAAAAAAASAASSAGKVIKGWDTGVATMKKGELANLVCRCDCYQFKQYVDRFGLVLVPWAGTLKWPL
jgi:hypothetical protein